MADLLTHVLIAYIAAKLLSLRYPWITTPFLTAAMLGGVLPDLNRIELFIPGESFEAITGLPFSWWGGLHRTGPIVISILIVAYLVSRRYRRRVIAMLALGAGLHLSADLFLGSGLEAAFAVLWPLTAWEPVLPGFYSSRDIRIAPLFLVLAAVTWWFVERRKHRRSDDVDQGAVSSS